MWWSLAHGSSNCKTSCFHKLIHSSLLGSMKNISLTEQYANLPIEVMKKHTNLDNDYIQTVGTVVTRDGQHKNTVSILLGRWDKHQEHAGWIQTIIRKTFIPLHSLRTCVMWNKLDQKFDTCRIVSDMYVYIRMCTIIPTNWASKI